MLSFPWQMQTPGFPSFPSKTHLSPSLNCIGLILLNLFLIQLGYKNAGHIDGPGCFQTHNHDCSGRICGDSSSLCRNLPQGMDAMRTCASPPCTEESAD